MVSRFGSDCVEKINEEVKNCAPFNTVKSRKSVWAQFEKFCGDRSYDVTTEALPIEKLNDILLDWGYNMRKSNGTHYKELVVKQMWNSIAKQIQETYYEKFKIKINPFIDTAFKTSRNARDLQRKKLQMNPDLRKVSAAALTETEIQKIVHLYDENTPEGLQKKFYHVAAHELVWRGGEGTHCLITYFKEEQDSKGTCTGRIEYNPIISKTAQGGAKKLTDSKWLIPNKTNESACPVSHVTKTASWLPPAESWNSSMEGALPYGWERALDDQGKPYFINHVNKTTTYETPAYRGGEEHPEPEPRSVTLERSPALGFGFVAGSEKPVIVRFVTEGGPSVDKLLPGDQILSVNGEDVKVAPREHVITLVRACSNVVTLVVCQPSAQNGALKSTFLSASKRQRLRSRPSRVRFAESVCVNGAPLFPPSAFSLGEISAPPMANVLKVFLENGQTKSFKYDAWTTVQDVVTSLQTKLCIQAAEHFSLVVEHIKSLRRNKLTLLDPADTLARIASRPGAHKLRCLFRVTFVPSSAATLAQKDLTALDYLYTQCCNDVTLERFAPELQYDIALRLAALHIYQHALTNNLNAARLTVKQVEREFGLERFVPPSILETMKRKEIRKLLAHFLKLHGSMAGPGRQLTVLQTKLHYLDLVAQLPSYGAKCFSAGPRGDHTERVLLVSPRFGISQITGTRNSVPVPIANIEDMRHVEVRSEDELFRLVLIHLFNDRTISVCLEERDASELILVLRGYYRLVTEQALPIDQDQIQTFEEPAPPYLSLHNVLPEKWSYMNQDKVQQVSFTVPPVYHLESQTNIMFSNSNKPSLVGTLSLDRNMNNSMSNRNHRIENMNSDKCNSYDLQSVVSMEILESNMVEARNGEVLRRVQEMQQLVENSEKYLTEQKNGRILSEWQESSVDIESDNDSVLSSLDDTPGKLKHSDSLLLLTQGSKLALDISSNAYSHGVIDMLHSEMNQSESDNDSTYTPHNSPNHKTIKNNSNKNSNARVSFGLRSPDNSNQSENDLKHYLKQLKEQDNSIPDVYDFDPDIIDLTLLPPPATPDELDAAHVIASNINNPPVSFADCGIIDNSLLNDDIDLEEFLASVTVPPPTQQVTPAVELTPEEIMSYIIPPPPEVRLSMENLYISINKQQNNSARTPNENDIELKVNGNIGNGVKRRNSNCSVKSNIIEYATVDRKGPFSCCSKGKSDKNLDDTTETIQLPPKKCSTIDKPPERPPKFLTESRQRSQSLSSSQTNAEPPPELPPRGEINHHAPSHIFLPPKKPPLPPVPPLEVLRGRKNIQITQKNPPEIRTAGIGSPHLQRNKNVYNDIDSRFGVALEPSRTLSNHSTAISTPTSPHLGRGAYHLTAVNIRIPDIENKYHDKTLPHPDTPPGSQKFYPEPNHHIRTQSESGYHEKCATLRHTRYSREPEFNFQRNGDTRSLPRNGCSMRENLLAKTDVAMANLLVRLDQVAAQCSAAQVRGGGTLMCEEKFQIAKDELTSQSLQLVTSSKMLVIAMSDPSLPDLPENLAICLTILRRLTELSQDLTNHTTAPLQTRNLILKVYDVTAAFRHLINADIDRTSQKTIEEHLTQQAEGLAAVLATLLRSLRVFSP